MRKIVTTLWKAITRGNSDKPRVAVTAQRSRPMRMPTARKGWKKRFHKRMEPNVQERLRQGLKEEVEGGTMAAIKRKKKETKVLQGLQALLESLNEDEEEEEEDGDDGEEEPGRGLLKALQGIVEKTTKKEISGSQLIGELRKPIGQVAGGDPGKAEQPKERRGRSRTREASSARSRSKQSRSRSRKAAQKNSEAQGEEDEGAR